MMKKTSSVGQIRAHTPDDITNAQARYAESRNPMYLVLAIGAQSDNPPQWAMEEACRLAWQAGGAAQKGNDRVKRGEMLDDVAREFFRQKESKPLGAPHTPPSLRSVVIRF